MTNYMTNSYAGLPVTTLSALLETQQQVLAMLQRLTIAVETLPDRLPRPAKPREKQLLPLRQIAKAIHCNPATVRRKILDGTYPAHRVGKKYLLDLDEIFAISRRRTE